MNEFVTTSTNVAPGRPLRGIAVEAVLREIVTAAGRHDSAAVAELSSALHVLQGGN